MSNKRVLVSFKDLQISYLTNGLEGVKACKDFSKATLRRTIRALTKDGKACEDLSEYYAAEFGSFGKGRGAPTVGEARTYKVQKITKSGPFLRLPLDSLGVEKGDSVNVAFGETGISVQKAI